MSAKRPPTGGVFAGKTLRSWRWQSGDAPVSAPAPCKREQWYLVRAFGDESMNGSAAVFAEQLINDEIVEARRVPLTAFADGARANQRVGAAWA